MCAHKQCFRAKKENNDYFSSENNILTAVKNHCMLHGHVFVMCENIHVHETSIAMAPPFPKKSLRLRSSV